MGAENVAITGNQTANNNQVTGGGNGGVFFTPPTGFQYARVVNVFNDRSISYEIIKDNLNLSAVNSPKITGRAYNFNPNFTRLPQINELVPIIKGPTQKIGNKARMYDEIDYYILGPISVQLTVDDNKVPQDLPPTQINSITDYKLNDIGVVSPQPGQVVPVEPPPPPPSPSPSNLVIVPSPTPSPTPPLSLDPRGTFRENYINRAGNEFELFSKKSGFNTTVYAYKKGTTILISTGSPSSTAPINVLINEIKLALQDNVYP